MKKHVKITSRYRGVTLPELIVVMAVAVMLLAAAIPSISAMRRAIQDSSGTNAITAAVTAARSHVAAGQADLQDMGSVSGIQYEGITYQGVAVLFTPAGELRLVEHDQGAKKSVTELHAPDRNVYKDVPDQEYVQLPSDVGVVGISRGNGGLYLFTPPFAVRYNQAGNLIARISQASDKRKYLVYYDADQDGTIQVTDDRASGYNPDDYDPAISSVDSNNSERAYEFSLEEIETVIGVVTYSKKELREASKSLVSAGTTRFPLNSSAAQWLLDDGNGQAVFFSRYSGAQLMR